MRLRTIPISYFPVLVLAGIVLWLSLVMHWQGDAVAFSFFIPAENEDFSSIPLNNIWDILPSMCNHWHNSTGRFFTHAIVQLFCGFIGKTGFAICNAIVWSCFVLMLLKLAKIKAPKVSVVVLACLLTFLLFYPLNGFEELTFPFEPPHQVNYVWMGLWNLAWIFIFLKEDRSRIGVMGFILLAIFSFLGGQANESFSIPIGGAILVYAFRKRMRISAKQYVMAIFYGIGALLVILAPGNFHRMGVSGGGSILHTAERLVPCLVIPFIWFLSWIYGRKKGDLPNLRSIGYSPLFPTAIIISYALGVFLGLESGSRMVTCANALLAVLILMNFRKAYFNFIVTLLMILLVPAIGFCRYKSIIRFNSKNLLIERLYHASPDGIVVLPDETFLYDVNYYIVRPHPFMMMERAVNPDKPNIAILPESMKKLNLEKDTNMILPLADQAWLLIQSRTAPADFVINKTLLPGILNHRMAPRIMDWHDPYAVFDSTKNWRASIYINTRPYIKSQVEISER